MVGAATSGTRRLGASPKASPKPTHPALHAAVMQHEMGTPDAAGGPKLGEQPDGSYVWRVRVAGMDMEHMIDA